MSEASVMDREEVKTEWEKPEENPLKGKSQEDIRKILEYRSQLLMDLSEAYVALTKAIFRLPIHVIYRQHAFLFLDTAEQWAKKGIDNVWDLPSEDKAPEPKADAPQEELVDPA